MNRRNFFKNGCMAIPAIAMTSIVNSGADSVIDIDFVENELLSRMTKYEYVYLYLRAKNKISGEYEHGDGIWLVGNGIRSNAFREELKRCYIGPIKYLATYTPFTTPPTIVKLDENFVRCCRCMIDVNDSSKNVLTVELNDFLKRPIINSKSNWDIKYSRI